MGQFGEELRRERESRGVSLECIINSTKISGRHLSALEREQFEQLPGGVFNKGIVRGYARAVGIDEEAWIQRFMSAYKESGLLKAEDGDWVEFAENVVKGRKSEGDRPAARLRWAGVFLLLMLIAGLGWFVYHFVRERISATNPSAGFTVLATVVAPDLLPFSSGESASFFARDQLVSPRRGSILQSISG
ncbi:Transcriptional regulator [Acidisarcina polymorpha]|uniref:Transcriptional regulator n=1 Tax=Acidisarcina polymorpha TaxID=2211140 RepID=A0A2Z5G1S2_9BACT|nr:helix-turn-helix domain-containing protein [Acidisarcina polymorpha]AXC13123.1 Transcriptional regulator [Acidisarcina polymorpha]